MEISAISHNRFQRILEILENKERVNVAELSEALHVSPVTVRRDLDKLNDLGLLERIHGGAQCANRRPAEVTFNEKTRTHVNEKVAIAKMAASLVKDGDSVFLNSGSTTQHVVRYIKNKRVRVVTNNAAVAGLEVDPSIELIVIGGELRALSSSLIGDIALTNLANIHCTTAILGVNGVSVDKGLTSAVSQETSINRMMIENTQQNVVVLADSSKINRVSTFFSAPLAAAQTLITDSNCSEADAAPFVAAGLDVIRA